MKNKVTFFIKSKAKIITFFFLVILGGYWGVWHSFFQQDEWNGLGKFYLLDNLNLKTKIVELYTPMFKSGLAHFLPFLPISNFFRYSLFGLNFEFYALLSLILHLLATLTSYFFIKTYSKNTKIALIGATFFAILPNASQAVTWVATSLPTQIAYIFSILSLSFWIMWIRNEKNKSLFVSGIFLLLAIGFKETALFLFLFFPFTYFYFKRKFNKRIIVSSIVIVLLYLLIRIGILSNEVSFNQAVKSGSNLFITAITNYFKIVFPGTTQSFLPQELLYYIITKSLKNFSSMVHTQPLNPLWIENFVIKPILWVLGLVISLMLILKRKYFYTAYLFISLIPIAFINTGELSSLFLSARSLYIPMLAVCGILGEIGWEAMKNKKYLKTTSIIFYFFICLFALKVQNNETIKEGQIRKDILIKIKRENPVFSRDIVFYVESDSPYYGLEEKIPPFQSGFGQTLLVWFYPEGHYSKEFLRDEFLWDIKSQGIKFIDGHGFGFFRDKDLFIKSIQEKNIAIESIVSYKWHGDTLQLENTTRKTRNELRQLKSNE